MREDRKTNEGTGASRRGIHWWVRRFFFAWAILSTLWVANKMRTRGVSAETLRTSPAVAVSDGPSILEFRPTRAKDTSALIFFCGAGVSAHAYAPLLRPVAEAGYPVFIVKLPYRFAPFESHKKTAIDRARGVIAAHPNVAHWVVSGHSLGGALAARTVHSRPADIAAVVLIGTTHPRREDLSALRMPVTKVYASNDGVAPYDRVQATKHLLPAHTRWVEIRGGNHSQFGHYGHQLLDGEPAITRAAQQAATRSAILEALANSGARASSSRRRSTPPCIPCACRSDPPSAAFHRLAEAAGGGERAAARDRPSRSSCRRAEVAAQRRVIRRGRANANAGHP